MQPRPNERGETRHRTPTPKRPHRTLPRPSATTKTPQVGSQALGAARFRASLCASKAPERAAGLSNPALRSWRLDTAAIGATWIWVARAWSAGAAQASGDFSRRSGCASANGPLRYAFAADLL